MFTTTKAAIFAVTAIVAGHVIVGAASYVTLQKKAEVAAMPIVVAQRIEVRPIPVVRAEAIVVTAKPKAQHAAMPGAVAQ